ncbi:putative phosphatase phospho1 [Phytophthora boehmeriae]|uniref:Putative phosphatase phospho1 n=1 Tax=Phytophthora boehmeriae TaxID=109152 RepID=A0A8T1X2P7_9STRA|nr:putative phosphatase phospho1 [Phytophthora boehmeriae]
MADPAARPLVIFDFDESLVDTDSDAFVLQHFLPEHLHTIEARHAQKPVWPLIVDEMLQILAADKPSVTAEHIRAHVAQIPIQERMLDAVRLAVERFGAEVKIISDGNTFYIDSVLEHRGLKDIVTQVFANPGQCEHGDTKLRIRPFHPDHLEPLGCTWCPVNMCKGSIVESIRQEKQYSRVIYVGDGVGDFCPATHLTGNDVVLARTHVGDGKPYGLQKQIDANPGAVKAPVVPWSTGHDIYRCFAQFCQADYAIPHMVSRIPGRVLVIFDYDWSLINDNSDTFIFQVLYPELLATLRERRTTQPSWTKMMDDMLGDLAKDKPDITPAMIRDAIAKVPIQPRMLDALRLVVDQHNADVKIVSDANSIYIQSMLELQDLTRHVSEVITNPAAFEVLENGHRLRVHPYHAGADKPHACRWCPTNMCKGRIVDTLRSAQPYAHVLYVGDGSGDFCAATHLTKDDILFARADESDGKSYGLQKRINANPEMIKASVVPWSTGDDIYRRFAQFFHTST